MSRTPHGAAAADTHHQKVSRFDVLLYVLLGAACVGGAVSITNQVWGQGHHGAPTSYQLVAAALGAALTYVSASTGRWSLSVATDGHQVWARQPGALTSWNGPVDLDDLEAVEVFRSRPGAGFLKPTDKRFDDIEGGHHLARYGTYSLALVARQDSADNPASADHSSTAWLRRVSRAPKIPVWDPYRGELSDATEVLAQVAPAVLESGAHLGPGVRETLERAVAAGGDRERFTWVATPMLAQAVQGD